MTKLAEAIHSVFAFSASPRWIPCAGSMADPINYTDTGVDAGEYADEGTAAHTVAAGCLKQKLAAGNYIGHTIKAGKREFEVTEEFAGHVQTYVDDVQRRSIGGYLMVEQRVTLEGIEGFDESNYGTSDAIIAMPARKKEPAYGVIIDLKFGQGERVYAYLPATSESLFTMVIHYDSTDSMEVEPNYQLMMYALAALADIRMLVDDPKYIILVINQPRLGILSELRVPIAVLERFAIFAAEALEMAEMAKVAGVDDCMHHDVETKGRKFFNPGEKQCRWCKRITCAARDAKVAADVGADFDVINEEPAVPVNAKQVALAMKAVPFVADWCRHVMAKANELVGAGIEVIGPDKKPYKFVEGDLGKRKWKNVKAAEETLLLNLPRDKVFKEVMITAPAAGKLLNKGKTKATWEDIFTPLIGRAPGKPILVQGSDPRPPYSPSSEADEFDVETDDDE